MNQQQVSKLKIEAGCLLFTVGAALTTLSVGHPEVDGGYGGVCVVAVVLQEGRLILPGLLHHRDCNSPGRTA